MTKTLIDIDDELLDEAKRTLGTDTKKETVAKALEAVVDGGRERRRRALQDLKQADREGAFDWDLLPELDK